VGFGEGGFGSNPVTFSGAWVESDHCWGAMGGSPTVYRSGSPQDLRQGNFVGLPERVGILWTLKLFTLGHRSGKGYQQESWVNSAQDCAVSVELSGEFGWRGPWNIGTGRFAWTRGWKNLPFWITGEKTISHALRRRISAERLCTRAPVLPGLLTATSFS
jgi:hypothetical protein